MATPRECEHAKLVGELRCKLVINMGGVAHPVQKQKGVSISSPIQVMELYAVDCDESSFVGRLVLPIRLRIEMEAEHQRYYYRPDFCLLCGHTSPHTAHDANDRNERPEPAATGTGICDDDHGRIGSASRLRFDDFITTNLR